MKYIKAVSLIVTLFLTVGCSNSTVKQLKNDIYVIYKEDHRGIFGTAQSFKNSVYKEAEIIAKRHNGVVVEVSSQFTPVGLGFAQWATFKYEFRVVNPENYVSPVAASEVSEFCMLGALAIFDDGHSNVETLARAVVRQCENECVGDQMKANNLSAKSEASLRNKCTGQALDSIFLARHVKRDGGELKKYGRFIYLKRKGDSLFINGLSVRDVTGEAELMLHCQVGVDSASINMHRVELSGHSIFSDFKIDKFDYNIAKLDVNGKPTDWAVGSKDSAFILTIPSPVLDDIYMPSERLTIQNDDYKLEFRIGGYRDAIKKMKAECESMKGLRQA